MKRSELKQIIREVIEESKSTKKGLILESKDNSQYIVTMRYTPVDEGNLNNTFTTFMGKELDGDLIEQYQDEPFAYVQELLLALEVANEIGDYDSEVEFNPYRIEIELTNQNDVDNVLKYFDLDGIEYNDGDIQGKTALPEPTNLEELLTTIGIAFYDADETKIKIGGNSASITTDQQYQLYKVKPTSSDLRSGEVFVISPRYLELLKKFK